MSKRRPKQNNTEQYVVEAIDRKAVVDDIQEQLRPLLAQAMREGWTVDKLYQHPQVQLLLAMRAISIGGFDPDSGKALAAVKDIQDRTTGKPVERRETKHILKDLPEEQLDAKLRTLLGTDDDEKTSQH